MKKFQVQSSIFFLLFFLFVSACSPIPNPSDTPVVSLTSETQVITLSPTQTPTRQPTKIAPPGTIFIDPGGERWPISKLVYGVNHGPWAFMNEKTIPLAADVGITLVRFPGGNWGDENDLLPLHIDQFVTLSEQVGAQTSINVRLFNGSAEKAAELVRYANVDKGYNIRYWGIGNEPTLFATARGVPNYGVKQFNAEWREIALAMKTVDPDILLIGPELHQFADNFQGTPKDPQGLDWMSEFLIANGDLVDIVSIHRYPFPQGRGGRAATIEELAATSAEWNRIIPYLRSVIFETTGRDLPVAVTEVNSHWSNATGGPATPDSFFSAIWWADVLGRMMVEQVEMVNYFSLQSNPSLGGYGIFTRSAPRPSYTVYQMYSQFGSEMVNAVSDEPLVGVYAAWREDGVLTVMLVNLNNKAVTKPIQIDGFETWEAEIILFTEESNLETLPVLKMSQGDPITLEPLSLTLMVIK